jgi:hypothetical protein
MAHHKLTLNWIAGEFRPDKDVLFVTAGDSISFHLGTAPANSHFKITMDDPQFFSAAEVTDSHTSITVVKAASSGFRCQLFGPDGQLLSAEGQAGAHVQPMGT